ncbi:MAG: DUF6580 family putative transport protein [Chthoniobacterales bacterium]
MKNSPARLTTPVLALAIALLILGAAFRVIRLEALPQLPNFAPLMAIAICGALLLPGWMALVVPFSALLVSDLLLNFHYGAAAFGSGEILRYSVYAVGIAAGLVLRRRQASPLPIFAAVSASSLLFYLVTNTAAWFGNVAYPQSLGGLVQSLTVGLPGFPPTWVFFRNSLVSDLLFTAIILGVVAVARNVSSRPVALPADARQAA